MSSNKDLRRAKHVAYEKKQAAKGEKVIKWIFGVLIALAIIFAIYASSIAYFMNRKWEVIFICDFLFLIWKL